MHVDLYYRMYRLSAVLCLSSYLEFCRSLNSVRGLILYVHCTEVS